MQLCSDSEYILYFLQIALNLGSKDFASILRLDQELIYSDWKDMNNSMNKSVYRSKCSRPNNEQDYITRVNSAGGATWIVKSSTTVRKYDLLMLVCEFNFCGVSNCEWRAEI